MIIFLKVCASCVSQWSTSPRSACDLMSNTSKLRAQSTIFQAALFNQAMNVSLLKEGTSARQPGPLGFMLTHIWSGLAFRSEHRLVTHIYNTKGNIQNTEVKYICLCRGIRRSCDKRSWRQSPRDGGASTTGQNTACKPILHTN